MCVGGNNQYLLQDLKQYLMLTRSSQVFSQIKVAFTFCGILEVLGEMTNIHTDINDLTLFAQLIIKGSTSQTFWPAMPWAAASHRTKKCKWGIDALLGFEVNLKHLKLLQTPPPPRRTDGPRQPSVHRAEPLLWSDEQISHLAAHETLGELSRCLRASQCPVWEPLIKGSCTIILITAATSCSNWSCWLATRCWQPSIMLMINWNMECCIHQATGISHSVHSILSGSGISDKESFPATTWRHQRLNLWPSACRVRALLLNCSPSPSARTPGFIFLMYILLLLQGIQIRVCSSFFSLYPHNHPAR